MSRRSRSLPATLALLLLGCGSELEGRAPALEVADSAADSAEPAPEDAEVTDARDDEEADAEADEEASLDSASETDEGPDMAEADTADGGPPGPCDGLGEGAPCDDGNACTLGDRCVEGACVPATARACDDGNPCTDDTCRPEVGCVNLANLATCDDGDPCTSGDRCSAGRCRPGGPTCDDLNPCTRDSCASSGACSHVADDSLECEDGSACTSGDFCAGGVCMSGRGDGCAEDDPCIAATCGADGLTCAVQRLEGTPCDDDDACTTGDVCSGGVCRSGAGVVCPWDSECAAFRCDRRLGCVLDTVYQAGKSCSDDDRCTLDEACDGAGVCAPSEPAACDDDNPCTEDSCDATWGCEHDWVYGPCDDASACTFDDECEFGQCRGTLLACDDGDACTSDSCDPLVGCQHLAIVCDDHNACTNDSCDHASGCRFTARTGSCEDGLACTVLETCQAGVCVAGATTCDDDDPCTIDRCDAEEGCVSSPLLPCPVGALRIAAVGVNASASGLGQWVAIANDGDGSFDLDGYAIRAEACDCEAAIEAVTISDTTLYGLRASSPPPSPGQLAPGGPASADEFDFVFGTPGDGFRIDATGDRVELVGPGGEVVDSRAVP